VKKDLSTLARLIEPGPDGIWISRRSAPISFPEMGNQLCFGVEDSSFWFAHRKNCLLEIIRRFPPVGTFFDIGGGNGYMSRALQDAGLEVVMLEPGIDGARNAQQRGVQNIIQSTVEEAGFAPGALASVGLFDVLEHIENDRSFLANLHRLQPSGGRIYVTVPSYSFLWSGEDMLAGHFRRHRLPSLMNLFERSGYQIEFASYLFSFLLLPVSLLRALPYRLGFASQRETERGIRADHVVRRSLAQHILTLLMAREEGRLRAKKKIYAGTSILLVARRP
jgi:SAM-dependent methyltransferase